MINLVLRLLRNEYPEYGAAAAESGLNLHALEGGVAAAALVGSIVGQLVAGEFEFPFDLRSNEFSLFMSIYLLHYNDALVFHNFAELLFSSAFFFTSLQGPWRT